MTREEMKPRVMALTQIDAPTGCWIWNGARTSGGYGTYRPLGTTAHRAAYVLFRGPIPDGLAWHDVLRPFLAMTREERAVWRDRAIERTRSRYDGREEAA